MQLTDEGLMYGGALYPAHPETGEKWTEASAAAFILDARTIVRLDEINFFAESRVLEEGEAIPFGWIAAKPPESEGDFLFTGSGWVALARADAPVIIAPPVNENVIRRVSKARFGDLFTNDEHKAMNLLRWQITQMDAAERMNPANPLTDVEILFQKFDLPAEFIELNNPLTMYGIGILGLLGVFGANSEDRITAILNNETPSVDV